MRSSWAQLFILTFVFFRSNEIKSWCKVFIPQSMARFCEKSLFPRMMMAYHCLFALFIIIIRIIFPTHPLSDTTSPLRGCKSQKSSLAVPCSTAGLWSSARQDWVGKQDFLHLKWTGFSASQRHCWIVAQFVLFWTALDSVAGVLDLHRAQK